MTALASPAAALYGDTYQQAQADKYRRRATNHWSVRIDLAFDLFHRHAQPRLPREAPAGSVCVVDVGCSIGTFAIEFARHGYRSCGIDCDPAAIDIARALAREEGVDPELIVGDVARWDASALGLIDVAVCFDIFEHLHDDQLGTFLASLHRNMSPHGTLLFHTAPTEFEHIFYERRRDLLLRPFSTLSRRRFEQLTRLRALLADAGEVLRHGRTRRERALAWEHCNLLSSKRLYHVLDRAGFDVLEMDSATLYQPRGCAASARIFARQPISHRNLFGAASPRTPAG